MQSLQKEAAAYNFVKSEMLQVCRDPESRLRRKHVAVPIHSELVALCLRRLGVMICCAFGDNRCAPGMHNNMQAVHQSNACALVPCSSNMNLHA